MNERRLRYSKFMLGLGIVVAVVFAIPVVVLTIQKEYVGTACFSIFVLLGLFLIYAYLHDGVVLREDEFELRSAFRPAKRFRYDEVQCVLLIQLSSKVSTVLVGKQYQRLAGMESVMIDRKPLFAALAEHGVPMEDFETLYKSGQDVSMYWPAMKWIERSYYKELDEANRNAEAMKKDWNQGQIEATQKRLKTLGAVLLITCAAAFVSDGKTKALALVGVVLVFYAVYLYHYPGISMGGGGRKGMKQPLQAPFLGPVIAFLLLVCYARDCSFDFGIFCRYWAVFAAVLLIPFIVQSVRAKHRQSAIRNILVTLAIVVVAFSMVIPVNYLLSFQSDAHEEIVITDKQKGNGYTYTYQLYGEWRGEERKFATTYEVYKGTEVGDTRQVGIRRSAIGFEYYTIGK